MLMLHIRVLFAAALFVFSSAAAHAETYDPAPNITAAQILDRARTARGTLLPGAYTRVDRDRVGGIETITTEYMNGDDWLGTYHSGSFTSMSGSYHGQNWNQNDNGIVTLRTNFRSKVDPNDLAWQHPDDPQYRVRVLGFTQAAPREYVVEANPPGGIDEYRYYDALTFLTDRIVRFDTDRYRHVAEYSDYRHVFGRTLAFKEHDYDGRPQNDDVSEIVSFDKTSAPVSLEIPASRSLLALNGSAPVTLPARFSADGIVVRASVNGRGLDFMLDSGASGLFIDPAIVHDLGLTPYGRQSETVGGGDVDIGRVRIPLMSIGSLQMHDVVFNTTPHNDQTANGRIIGLMGFDLLASAITEIDFKAQTVTVYPRAAFDPQKLGLIAVPLQIDDGIPRVQSSMEHVPGAFLIDTGAFAMLAYKNYVDKLPFAPIDDNDFALGTVGGEMSAQIRTVTDFIFGGVLFRSAQIVVPSRSTFDIPDYDAIIGRNALSVFQLYFDYANHILYVKRNT